MTFARTSFALFAAAAAVLTSAGAARAQDPAPAPASPPCILYVTPPPPSQPPPQPVPYAPPAPPPETYAPHPVYSGGSLVLTGWNDGDRVPRGYHPEDRARTGMIIGGAATFGAPYLLSLLSASVSADVNRGETNPLWPMYIPGVGPFIMMTQSSSATANLFLTIDGAAQVAGLAMLIYGLTSQQSVLVRDDVASAEKPHVTATPLVGRDMTGVGLSVTF